jgi:hypothetical protein
MPEPSKGGDVRTIALRVSPAYHRQLALVAQIDEITLTDLMQRALDNYMAERRAPRLPGQGSRRTRGRRSPDGADPCHAPRCCSHRGNHGRGCQRRRSGCGSGQAQGSGFRLTLEALPQRGPGGWSLDHLPGPIPVTL